MLDHDYDLGEELTRKAGEAYSWLDNQHKRGQLSDAAMYQSLCAMDMALLGLIPSEYSDWASGVRLTLPHSEPDKVRTFLSKDKTVVLKLNRAKGKVEVIAIPRTVGEAPTVKTLVDEESSDPHRWAEERFKSLTYGLIKKGFAEL